MRNLFFFPLCCTYILHTYLVPTPRSSYNWKLLSRGQSTVLKASEWWAMPCADLVIEEQMMQTWQATYQVIGYENQWSGEVNSSQGSIHVLQLPQLTSNHDLKTHYPSKLSLHQRGYVHHKGTTGLCKTPGLITIPGRSWILRPPCLRNFEEDLSGDLPRQPQ